MDKSTVSRLESHGVCGQRRTVKNRDIADAMSATRQDSSSATGARPLAVSPASALPRSFRNGMTDAPSLSGVVFVMRSLPDLGQRVAQRRVGNVHQA
jgi:hypothetical protein